MIARLMTEAPTADAATTPAVPVWLMPTGRQPAVQPAISNTVKRTTARTAEVCQIRGSSATRWRLEPPISPEGTMRSGNRRFVSVLPALPG